MKNLRNRIASRQSGFTLVEIAIVLVIIGLLLVGVLQGQEMIENTKVKSLVSDMKAIQAAYNGYIDRYKAIPGDDSVAIMNARGWPGTGGAVAGAATPNGLLVVLPAATFAVAAASEHEGFWRALRASGLLTGDPTALAAAAHPKHSMGGLIGIASNPGVAAPTILGRPGVFVCANNLTTKQAAAIDVLVDGPLPANQTGNDVGNLRASTLALAAGTPAATPYNETTVATWNVCMRIG
ncbi:MAG: prepilin-type N-terminal cleavage/methylation domain-containing protein [Sulfuritalea sp.]|nr:prepilin-type N-terminal cleavage/methylation domain-containing protein [Sulfuritalea sp.]